MAPVNTATYLAELKRRAPSAYDSLAQYEVVLEPLTGDGRWFSVLVVEDDRYILQDCNDTPEIDAWYDTLNLRRGDAMIMPCGRTFEVIEEQEDDH